MLFTKSFKLLAFLSLIALPLSGLKAIPLVGDVVIDQDTQIAPGVYELDSLTIQEGATLSFGQDSNIEKVGFSVTNFINIFGTLELQGFDLSLTAAKILLGENSSLSQQYQNTLASKWGILEGDEVTLNVITGLGLFAIILNGPQPIGNGSEGASSTISSVISTSGFSPIVLSVPGPATLEPHRSGMFPIIVDPDTELLLVPVSVNTASTTALLALGFLLIFLRPARRTQKS